MVSRIALATALVVGLSVAQSPKEAIADSKASCVSCLPKSFWDSVKSKVGSAYHATVEATKSVWNKGLDHVKAQASEMWAGIKSLDCGKIVDGLSGMDPMTILLDKVWKPSGVCVREFRKGAICAIPDMIRELIILAKDAVVTGWEHRSVCIPATIALPGSFPVCGLFYFAKEKIGKMARCFKAMSSDKFFSMLWQELWKLGCNYAGQIVMDIVLDALSAGAGLPATIAKWVKKVGDLVSPAKWAGIEKYIKASERVVYAVEKGVDAAVDYAKGVAKGLAACEDNTDQGPPDLVTQVKQLAKDKAAIVKKWGQDGWRLVEKTGRKGYEALTKHGREAIEAFKRLGAKGIETLKETAKKTVETAKKVVSGAQKYAKEKARIIRQWGQDAWKFVEAEGERAYEGLKKYGKDAAAAWKQFGQEALDRLADTVGKVREAAQAAKKAVTDAAAAAKKKVVDTAAAAKKKAEEVAAAAAKKVTETAAAAKKAAEEAAAAVKKKAEEVAAAAAKAAEQAAAAARAAFNMAGYGACLVKCCLYSPLQCSNQKTPTDLNACTATCDKTYNYSSVIAFSKTRYLGCVTKCCIDSPLQCSGARSSASDFDPCVKTCK